MYGARVQTTSESPSPATTERTGRLADVAFLVGLVAIVAIAAWARASALNPGSLWQDDAWVALIKKVAWDDGVVGAGRSTPIGFSLLTKVILDSSPDVELGAQAVPFLAGLAGIGLFGWLVLRVFGSRSLALLGAALFSISPALMQYAVRVKQYTLEALGTTLLLWLFWEHVVVRDERRARSLLPLCAAAVVLIPFGHATVFVAVTLIHLGLLWLWWSPRPGERRLPALAVCLGFDVLLGLYYTLVLRGQRSPSLDHFWTHHHGFAPLGEPWSEWLHYLRFKVWGSFITGAFPEGNATILTLCALLFVVGIAALLLGRERRVLGVALLLLYSQSVALSALHLYPMGSDRLDVYLHPAHLLFVVAGVWLLLQAVGKLPIPAITLPVQRWLPVLLALAVCARFLPGFGARRLRYHGGEGVGALIAAMEHDAVDADGILLDDKIDYVFTLNTHWDVHVAGRRGGAGLSIRQLRPGLLFLPSKPRPDLAAHLDKVAAHGHPRIFYLSIDRAKAVRREVSKVLERHGYRRVNTRSNNGAVLLTFVAPGSQSERPSRRRADAEGMGRPAYASRISSPSQ